MPKGTEKYKDFLPEEDGFGVDTKKGMPPEAMIAAHQSNTDRRIVREAEKELALNGGGNTVRSKKYRELVKPLVEKGVSTNPSNPDQLPSPATLIKIVDIAKYIAAGKSMLSTFDYIREKWGVKSDTSVRTYYNAALSYLIPDEEDRDKVIAKLASRYEQLYERAYEAGQYKTARDILDSMAKLSGLVGGNTIKYAENANGEKMVVVTFD